MTETGHIKNPIQHLSYGEAGEDLYNYMKEISPDIIVNERVCRGYGLGDFECPEQVIPAEALSRPWETCQTMNDAWGYNEERENSYRVTKFLFTWNIIWS